MRRGIAHNQDEARIGQQLAKGGDAKTMSRRFEDDGATGAANRYAAQEAEKDFAPLLFLRRREVAGVGEFQGS